MIFSLACYYLYEKSTLQANNQLIKKMSYHTNIIKETQDNTYFRRVLFTGEKSQLVVMSIPPGGEVGAEVHKYTEQTLFFLSGTGVGEFDGKKFPVVPGDVVVVVPGTEHNFTNTGTEAMKIYTVYAPPNHIDGRIHKTKAEADADTADEAVGETPPVK
jgi:mannose-6-phosphate isomerase-like protein (cupin superfamily)